MPLDALLDLDQKTVIVALDHGLIDGPVAGLVDLPATIAQVKTGGADAVLVSYGVARRFRAELEGFAVIVRIDGAVPGEGSVGRLFFSPDQAAEVGAKGVAVSAFPRSPLAGPSLEALASAVGQAAKTRLAVVAEMVPGGFDSPANMRSVETLAEGARIGAELGADLIKTHFCVGFEAVVASTFAPIVILGGSKRGQESEMLGEVAAAVTAGAVGVAIGRNVFQSAHPAGTTAALSAIVHRGASAEEAAKLLAV